MNDEWYDELIVGVEKVVGSKDFNINEFLATNEISNDEVEENQFTTQ